MLTQTHVLLAIPPLAVLLTALAAVAVLIKLYRQQCHPPVYAIYREFIATEKLGPYYVSLAEKLAMTYPEDEKGGPLVENATDGRMQYHLMAHVHRALTHYEAWIETAKIEHRDIFLANVRSILAHGERREDGALVFWWHQQHYANQKIPWLHAMAQGQVIMALCRAYQETDDQEFLQQARAAAVPFGQDVSEGGVRSTDPVRGVFYEEYAFHEPGKQHHTLNGMMSALMGLHDLWKISGDAQVREWFDTGIATIRANLPAYDFPFCSSYDLRHEHGENPLLQGRYNAVHVAHLRILAAMTGDAHFETFAARWEKTFDSRFNRLCYFAYYLYWKTRNLRKQVEVAGSWSATIRINLRRLARRFR